jgi:hypothetical protein
MFKSKWAFLGITSFIIITGLSSIHMTLAENKSKVTNCVAVPIWECTLTIPKGVMDIRISDGPAMSITDFFITQAATKNGAKINLIIQCADRYKISRTVDNRDLTQKLGSALFFDNQFIRTTYLPNPNLSINDACLDFVNNNRGSITCEKGMTTKCN